MPSSSPTPESRRPSLTSYDVYLPATSHDEREFDMYHGNWLPVCKRKAQRINGVLSGLSNGLRILIRHDHVATVKLQ